MNSNRTLLLINADTSTQHGISADRSKERLADYMVLKAELQGDIVDWQTIRSKKWSRLLQKVVGKGVVLAVLAWLKRNRYDVFYSDSENNGLFLALLFKLTCTRKPLFMIGHWITPPKKAFLFKYLKVHSNITKLFLHSSEQFRKAVETYNIPAFKLRILPYQVDTKFWTTDNISTEVGEPYICTAGLEFRDYSTLVEAVKDAPFKLKIGAASHWSKRKADILHELPSNVEVKSYNYQELRQLYAASSFVVVPLVDVDFQAGITVILEAMAMGKAVIVTRSQGQGDTVVDRRKTTRNGLALPTVGNIAQFFGIADFEKDLGQTGFYVSPGDPTELRKAIDYLLTNPARANEMGCFGRLLVEKYMRVEQFAARIKQVIDEELNPSQPNQLEKGMKNGA